MKIFINRKIIHGPWGGGNNFTKSLYDFLKLEGHQLVQSLEDKIDLIVMIDPRYDELGISINEIFAYKKKNPGVKIIHRINECDARKNTNDIDHLLLASNQIADETIFISEWLQNYFIQKGFNKESHVIYNGCDVNDFFPLKDKKITNPIKIVTHHWSDNWMKGFDIYKKIDELCQRYPEKYQFTYIGRYAKEYFPKNTTIIPPKFGRELGNELRKHDVYITASRWEPCGMHHIEGAASGLPVIYHLEGGGIVEGCKNHGVSFSSYEEIPGAINSLINDYQSYKTKIDYEFLSMKRCLKQYNDIINKVCLL